MSRSSKTSPHIAVLVEEYFNEKDLAVILKKLADKDIKASVVAPKGSEVQSMKGLILGKKFAVDISLNKAKSRKFDGIVLPGGIVAADKLRTNLVARNWIDREFENGRVIGAVGRSVWTLLSADIVEEMSLTGAPSIKYDIMNCGGSWVERGVVVDQNLITCQSTKDIPRFISAVVKVIKDNR